MGRNRFRAESRQSDIDSKVVILYLRSHVETATTAVEAVAAAEGRP